MGASVGEGIFRVGIRIPKDPYFIQSADRLPFRKKSTPYPCPHQPLTNSSCLRTNPKHLVSHDLYAIHAFGDTHRRMNGNMTVRHNMTNRTQFDFSGLIDWYLSNCDGDWEHVYGVKLETLDNPGWILTIDLAETDLDGKTLSDIREGTALATARMSMRAQT